MALNQDGDTRALTVFIESGTLDYTDLSRWMKSDPRDAPELVPNDENARSIVKNILPAKGYYPMRLNSVVLDMLLVKVQTVLCIIRRL